MRPTKMMAMPKCARKPPNVEARFTSMPSAADTGLPPWPFRYPPMARPSIKSELKNSRLATSKPTAAKPL